MRLLPNTIDGLRWGLENFDGVEFDIRLTADDKLVIHHDPVTESGDEIRLKKQSELDLPKIEDLFADETIRKLILSGKTLFIELKPDCENGKLKLEGMGNRFREALDKAVDDLPREEIRVLSFQTKLLDAFVPEYKAYPILPALNECQKFRSDFFMLLAYLPKVIGKSLKKHMLYAKEKGYAGIFFAREYMFGPTKYFHPRYEELVELSKKMQLDIGTNLGDFIMESDYRHLYRFSDQGEIHPRFAKEGEGKIIAHRGTGTKGVEVYSREDSSENS